MQSKEAWINEVRDIPNNRPMVNINDLIKKCTTAMSEAKDRGVDCITLTYTGSNIAMNEGLFQHNRTCGVLNRKAKYLYTMNQGLFIKRDENTRDFWHILYKAYQLPGEVLVVKDKDGYEVAINNPLGALTGNDLNGFCIAKCTPIPEDQIDIVTELISTERRERMCARCSNSHNWAILKHKKNYKDTEFYFCSKKCRKKTKDTDLDEHFMVPENNGEKK
jgi:YHS domain-containing protein